MSPRDLKLTSSSFGEAAALAITKKDEDKKELSDLAAKKVLAKAPREEWETIFEDHKSYDSSQVGGTVIKTDNAFSFTFFRSK